jgi:hypothetical protein
VVKGDAQVTHPSLLAWPGLLLVPSGFASLTRSSSGCNIDLNIRLIDNLGIFTSDPISVSARIA